MYILWIVVALAIIVIGWLIATYNSLVAKRNQVDEAWSDIDVQLKLRYDLVPRLVNTVKGFAAQEKSIFTEVTEARASAMKAEEKGDVAASSAAESALQKALVSVMAVAENYPDLKSDANFLKMQADLSAIEEKIQASRRFYNGTVRDFNTKLQQFPTNTVAGMFNFKDRDFFELDDEAEREAPEVDFTA